ncbi:MAG: hypothetical protein UHK44_11135 [Bacteroidaceae bacterium]|jgi:hypothetical protein|nr:hypothetical protein [Bacteroidaceae bacterium]
MDKKLREDILAEVRTAMREIAETYDEKYVTGKELCQQIAMFSPNWLEVYGWKLPRERIEVTDDSGERRVTRWGYPLHHIQRMIKEGKFREM